MNKFARLLLIIVIVLSTGFALKAMFIHKNDMTEEWAEESSQQSIEDDEDEDGDDDDDDDVPLRVEEHEGMLVIRLSPEQQQQSGIATTKTNPKTLRNEFKSYARVMSIDPLLEIRSQANQVLANKKIINAELVNAERKLSQLRILNKEASNISNRQLLDATAQFERHKAALQAENIKLNDIKQKTIQKWGAVLSDMILDQDSLAFKKLLTHDDALLLMSLKNNQSLNAGLGYVFVNKDNDRLKARKAYVISSAPQTDSVMQGETYYLISNGQGLRTGMRLVSWVQEDAGFIDGVFIPNQAVVYFAGKKWAYSKLTEELFARKSIDDAVYTGSGWLVRSNFEKNESLVISGSQLLLSEELRSSIPDEDDEP